tara:strand:- start:288 stop:407 length:120 start_codon:yes stop_codon:yes gene_type:complete
MRCIQVIIQQGAVEAQVLSEETTVELLLVVLVVLVLQIQ